MLDTIMIGMVRLNSRDKMIGYMRSAKSQPGIEVTSYFRIPIHAVFDNEGYNTYKDYLKKENPEFKTWVSDIVIQSPPPLREARYYAKAGNEAFLQDLYEMEKKSIRFPKKLKDAIYQSIEKYNRVKNDNDSDSDEFENEYEDHIGKEQIVASQEAIKLYGMLQRSRFDGGRPGQKGEFRILPFVRVKGDKTARELLQHSTNLVCDFLLENPRVSKYSEAEGVGLKRKLGNLFLEILYKEQIEFMRHRLKSMTYY
ncbi:hypothetical protein [Candidatus Uabimicrobium sp. HlEnr_7]|uniref:hypothetical protein n=1 Tax=Candidatus Uabimicrobium helgolandensis TaxID=3095367 RepID=UPI0035563A05